MLKQGKVPNSLLQQLLSQLPERTPDIKIPPGIGRDAAGLAIGNKTIAITTDPITLTSDQLGTYSVAVNINDLACLGCKPRWYTSNILLPIGSTEEQLTAIWENLVAELNRYNIQAIGGHMEVTPSVNTPIIIGQMIGEPIADILLDKTLCQPGDKILLWQSAGIEGTALLATERYQELTAFIMEEELRSMQQLLTEPGICIYSFVKRMLPNKGIVALHDPTEGGIATALNELAEASNCGITVLANNIPVLSTTQQLASILDFNPLGLLASGALLIVCKPHATDSLLKQFVSEPLRLIGELTDNDEKVLIQDGKKIPIPNYPQDEVIAALNKKL